MRYPFLLATLVTARRTRSAALGSFVIALVLAGCGRDRTNDGLVVVPDPERIPYASHESVLVDRTVGVDDVGALPPSLALLHRYLSQWMLPVGEDLGLMIGSRVRVGALPDGRLIVLDQDFDRLFEVDLETLTDTLIAEQGQGPGELQFANALAISGTDVYVAQGNRRLSRFDCATTPCTFAENLSIDQQAASIDVLSGDSLVVLGTRTPAMPEGLDAGDHSRRSLAILSPEGTLQTTFADAYNTEGHWMLERPLINTGFVRFSERANRYVLAYAAFPYVYAFGPKREIEHVYRLDPFVIGTYGYEPETGVLHDVGHTYNEISNVQLVDDGFVVVEIRTRTISATADEPATYRFDYYAIDLNQSRGFYLGGQETGHDSATPRLVLLDDAVLVNGQGSLTRVRP